MARYSLFVLKVPLNPKQTNKQTNITHPHSMCCGLSDTKAENGTEPRVADAGTQLSIDIALGRKRKIESNANEDSDDDSALAPPSNDIYRQRQQKKVK